MKPQTLELTVLPWIDTSLKQTNTCLVCINTRQKFSHNDNKSWVSNGCQVPVEAVTSFHMYMYQNVAYGTRRSLSLLKIERGHAWRCKHPSLLQQCGHHAHSCLLLQVLVLPQWPESRPTCTCGGLWSQSPLLPVINLACHHSYGLSLYYVIENLNIKYHQINKGLPCLNASLVFNTGSTTGYIY